MPRLSRHLPSRPPTARCRRRGVDPLAALGAWYASAPPARQLLASLDGLFERALTACFGYHALWLGALPADAPDYRRHARIRHHLDLSPVSGEIRARFESLPVATESVDLVVLWHALELSDDPHALLREVDRVLVPEGRVVIVHFNPWSWYGLWRLAKGPLGRMPWCLRFYGGNRIRDWLKLLGYAEEDCLGAGFVPPLDWARLQGCLARCDRRLARWPGGPAGVRVLRARKQVAAVTPLPLAWRPRKRVLAGVKIPGPTTRSHRLGERRPR